MSSASAGANPIPAWRPQANPWIIAAAVMAATFMEVLDTTVVNVALPHIAGNLSATTEEATWVLTSYLVSNAIILPATGWLSSYFGRKRFLMTCIVIFTAASLACGVATSLGFLIFARILQGAGGGALQPISQAILLESFPPHKRGLAMAVFGLGVVVAPIIGPTLGGWMTDNYSWRWVFYINLPVGMTAILMAQAFIEDPPYIRHARPGTIDYIGFGLLAIWVGALQVILDKGQQEDWLASGFIRGLLVCFAIGLVLFLVREMRAGEPIVNLRVLSNRNFTTGTIMMTIMGAVLYASIALVPLFLQTLLGYSALQSGLTVSPRGMGALAAMFVISRIIGLIDTRMLIAAGFTVLGISTLAFGDLNLQIAPKNIIWPNVISGIATAFIFVPLTTITMGTLRNEQIGNATGIFNLMRNLGGSIGIAMVATLLSRGAQTHQAIMVSHLNPYDPNYQHWLAVAGSAMSARSGEILGERQAQAMMYAQLLRQSSLWAFVDNFRLLAGLCFLCVPAVLIFRKPRLGGGPVAAH